MDNAPRKRISIYSTAPNLGAGRVLPTKATMPMDRRTQFSPRLTISTDKGLTSRFRALTMPAAIVAKHSLAPSIMPAEVVTRKQQFCDSCHDPKVTRCPNPVKPRTFPALAGAL